MAKYIQLQITFPALEEAQEAAAFLVESKLAACAQVIPGVQSRYVWQGETCESAEVLLLCKTRSALFTCVAAEISSRHSYDCPQIVGVPLDFISSSYAKWLDENIRNG